MRHLELSFFNIYISTFLDLKFGIDKEGEHQVNIFGSVICYICRKKHEYLHDEWWIELKK